MNEPWFDPNTYAWIPGTVLGVVCGVLGTLGGILAPAGRAKTLVVGSYYACLGASLLLLIVGAVALVSGQPYGIWYGLGLPGVVGTVILSALLPVILIRYREAEQRKMTAKDL